MMTSTQLLDYIYYRKIPRVYRTEDVKLGRPLYRYFKSLIQGGYAPLLEDMNNFINLIDPVKCPDEFFPYLYESFGLTYFHDIDISYQRKFLNNIGEVQRRRGTISLVRYIVRVITGMECDVSYLRGEHESVDGRWLFVNLLCKTMEQVNGVETSIFVVQRFLETHLPYYVTPVLSYTVSTQLLELNYYRAGAVSQAISYNLIPS